MTALGDYGSRFKYVRFDRRDGILQIQIHRDGKEAIWDFGPDGIHRELGEAFYLVGRDPENKVIIFTGSGEAFLDKLDYGPSGAAPLTPQGWDRIYKEGKDLLNNLLEIEVPVIGAVNGDATVHAELVLLSDIVVAADHAHFADAAHSASGVVPGDGVHVLWPMLLGPNRGRYFLLMGERIDAEEARHLGVVGEVVPRDRVLERAWAIARELLRKPPLMLRYSRVAMTLELKRRLALDLGYGLALEGLAAIAATSRGGDR